ncbi:hypothetical protein BCF33_0054 [Hasllibacter halocynthiae]|uniref:Uncharacterized protein n=1 Tax=Hasllibacter halocynthiae TaxID=595589 RepID=A0A2T0X6F2_9RHOB|nr:hypothetical protein [Hasllibacter halocynthiae]PRY94465.1 hypothetical protein BCF33_0054 [Hasllibacter halocynthiae]
MPLGGRPVPPGAAALFEMRRRRNAGDAAHPLQHLHGDRFETRLRALLERHAGARQPSDGTFPAVFPFAAEGREVSPGVPGFDPGAAWRCALEDRPAAMHEGRLRLPPYGVARPEGA